MDVLLLVAVVAEDVRIGVVVDEGAVVLAGGGQYVALLDELSFLEDDRLHRLIAVGGDRHTGGEGIDRLEANAIEPDRLLEDLVVVLGTGIHRAYGLGEGALGDASPVVADGDVAMLLLVDRDVDVLAVPHRVLVDGVVDHLLEEDVDAVVGSCAVAQLADVHTGTEPDVLHRVEGDDLILLVEGVGCGGQ